MKNKKEYIIPQTIVIELITEPVMNQSGTSSFSNKTGIRQGEKSSASDAEETFWTVNFFSGK